MVNFIQSCGPWSTSEFCLCSISCELICGFCSHFVCALILTRCRLGWLDNSLIRVYTVCHSVCISWTCYSMVEPHRSNFRVITTNFLGVRIFRKFTVGKDNYKLFFVIFQQSYGPWLMDFDKILFMHWYIWSMFWLIHIIFPELFSRVMTLDWF